MSIERPLDCFPLMLLSPSKQVARYPVRKTRQRIRRYNEKTEPHAKTTERRAYKDAFRRRSTQAVGRKQSRTRMVEPHPKVARLDGGGGDWFQEVRPGCGAQAEARAKLSNCLSAN